MGDEVTRASCRSGGYRGAPELDVLGLWWCRECAEPLGCDECGQQLPHEHRVARLKYDAEWLKGGRSQ